MAKLDNLKTFCANLTEDEKQFLIRTEIHKMWQLFRDIPESALLAMQTHAKIAKSPLELPQEMKACFSGLAVTPFQDPVLIELTETQLDLLREHQARKQA